MEDSALSKINENHNMAKQTTDLVSDSSRSSVSLSSLQHSANRAIEKEIDSQIQKSIDLSGAPLRQDSMQKVHFNSEMRQ